MKKIHSCIEMITKTTLILFFTILFVIFFSQSFSDTVVVYAAQPEPVEFYYSGMINSTSSGKWVLMDNGSLWYWGDDYRTSDTLDYIDEPIKVMDNVQSFYESSYDNCYVGAIKKDGSLWMWGDNTYGQIGDGTTNYRYSPVKVLENVKSLYLDFDHIGNSETVAALKTDGSLWIWGDNSRGQIGDGTQTDRHKPVKILDDVKTAGSGILFSAAIKNDGTLWMWGENYHGSVGAGTTQRIISAPAKVMEGVKSIEFNGYLSMSLKQDGSLWMWGDNSYGQGGSGTASDIFTPTKILDNVKFFSNNSCSTAAIKNDSTLWMWGANNEGELGDGSTANRYSPVRVMDNVRTVSIISGTSAAIKNDGTLWMWGANTYGQIGDGTTSNRTSPKKILDNVASVDLDDFNGATVKAIQNDGRLWTWGNNSHGELGNGTTNNSPLPINVLNNVKLEYPFAAIKEDGTLWAWYNETPSKVMTNVETVLYSSPLGGYGWAKKSDGSLWGWDIFNTPAEISIVHFYTPIKTVTFKGIGTKYFTGKAIKLGLSLSDSGHKLVEGTDYTVSYSKNTYPGTATVTIKGKGSYTGSIKKSFAIKLKPVSVSSISGGKKSFTVKWKKATSAQQKLISGYQLRYSLKSDFKSGVKTVKTTNKAASKVVLKKLKAKKTYYVQMRTFYKRNGKTYYSSWSTKKRVKTK